MKSQTFEELVRATENLLDAANELWRANNPDEDIIVGDSPPMPLDQAQENHANAFLWARRCVWYARKELRKVNHEQA